MSTYRPQSPEIDNQSFYDPASPVMDMDLNNYQSSSKQMVVHSNFSIQDDFPPLLPNPKKPKLSSIDEVMEFSSDPIAGPSNHYQYNSAANQYQDPNPSVKGKGKETLSSSMHSKPSPVNNQGMETTKTVLLQARDLIIKAYDLTNDRTEQSQLLDLLEVFREYTEKGNLSKASTIIASQVANLETATRQIETKARALSKIATPTTPTPKSRGTSLNNQGTATQPLYQQASMASIAASGIGQSNNPLQWTVVGKKGQPQVARPQQPTQQKN